MFSHFQAQVATDLDYKESQMKLYANYDCQNQQFLARGHLTPNADFTTKEERAYTMITTNIAPQWQLFNGGNWNNLETALRKYATQNSHALYVFTGTGKHRLYIETVLIKLFDYSCISGRFTRFFRAQTHTYRWYKTNTLGPNTPKKDH